MPCLILGGYHNIINVGNYMTQDGITYPWYRGLYDDHREIGLISSPVFEGTKRDSASGTTESTVQPFQKGIYDICNGIQCLIIYTGKLQELTNLNEGHLELISLKLTMLPARENCEVVIKFTQIHHDVLCFCSPSVECLADCGIRLFLLLRKYLEAHPTDRRFGE